MREHEDPASRMLAAKTVAVVGVSNDTSRAAHHVAAYLQQAGIEVIPVNPNCDTVLGVKCYPSVQAIGRRVDVVDVFRRPEFCPGVVEDAVAADAGGVWLQSGIVSEEARRLAEEAGLDFVQNRCLMVDHSMRREEG